MSESAAPSGREPRSPPVALPHWLRRLDTAPGVIDVAKAQGLYARTAGWAMQHMAHARHLLARYAGADHSEASGSLLLARVPAAPAFAEPLTSKADGATTGRGASADHILYRPVASYTPTVSQAPGAVASPAASVLAGRLHRRIAGSGVMTAHTRALGHPEACVTLRSDLHERLTERLPAAAHPMATASPLAHGSEFQARLDRVELALPTAARAAHGDDSADTLPSASPAAPAVTPTAPPVISRQPAYTSAESLPEPEPLAPIGATTPAALPRYSPGTTRSPSSTTSAALLPGSVAFVHPTTSVIARKPNDPSTRSVSSTRALPDGAPELDVISPGAPGVEPRRPIARTTAHTGAGSASTTRTTTAPASPVPESGRTARDSALPTLLRIARGGTTHTSPIARKSDGASMDDPGFLQQGKMARHASEISRAASVSGPSGTRMQLARTIRRETPTMAPRSSPVSDANAGVVALPAKEELGAVVFGTADELASAPIIARGVRATSSSEEPVQDRPASRLMLAHTPEHPVAATPAVPRLIWRTPGGAAARAAPSDSSGLRGSATLMRAGYEGTSSAAMADPQTAPPGASGVPGEGDSPAAPIPDLGELAERVARLIARRLEIERDRRGGRT